MREEHYRSQLPAEYRGEDVFPYLSYDAQVYYACTGCRGEYRLNQALSLRTPATYVGTPCPSRCGGNLAVVLHQVVQEALCHDCGKQWDVRSSGFDVILCPRCHSRQYIALSTWLRRPFPHRFHELTPPGSEATTGHEWGHDTDADVQLVYEQLQSTGWLPNPDQYLIPAALFLDRLQAWGDHDPTRVWKLTNLFGLLLREYYRQTGELTAGTAAVGVLHDIREAPAAPFERGLLLHNVSMAAYSLLARRQPELHFYGGPEYYRDIGKRAAHQAIACYESLQAGADAELAQALRLQIARVRHVLADLLKAGEVSSSVLTEAIGLLDQVVHEPALPPDMRSAAQRSRAEAVLRARAGAKAPPGQVLDDLSASLPELENLPLWEQNSLLTRVAEYREGTGDLPGALEFQQRAATTAEEALTRADDETTLGQLGRQYGHTFDILARMEVKSGRPRAALAAVETVRAATVRFGHEGERTAMRRIESELGRLFRGGAGSGAARRDRDATGEQEPTAQALSDLFRAGWPQSTAYCALSGGEGQLTAVLAFPDGTDRWDVRGLQWPVEAQRILDMTRGINLESGPFRERRLAAACALARTAIFDHLLPELHAWGAHGLAISAPGLFSHLPYEAVPTPGDDLLGNEFEVFYLPSLQLGSALQARHLAQPARPGATRALAVVHGGEGLPGARGEVARMADVWGGRLDVLDGAEQNKKTVLDALAGAYDVIHFACHGSYDPLQPLESALYLTEDRSQDARRITAGDLLGRSFAQAPVVTLAACESGLTSYGLTSDCTGLTGGLLRMGARGVIASRWAVTTAGTAGQELAAERFTGLVHRSLASSGTPSGRRAVTRAQRELARQGAKIEDWAAFSYLGIP
ncbi:CHAT domain-containing protein [Streptomyces sp. SYP-A7185]|uniref:CHAT domain-containing protein n=1 Tax=Streptomyces sp. SYP-A7185 TaxID=3040076 RepID=UPI0038F6AB09